MYIWNNKNTCNDKFLFTAFEKSIFQYDIENTDKLINCITDVDIQLITCDKYNLYIFHNKTLKIYNIQKAKLVKTINVNGITNIKFDDIYLYILHKGIIGIYFKKCLNDLKTIESPKNTSLIIESDRIISNSPKHVRCYNKPKILSHTEKRLIIENDVSTFKLLLTDFISDAPSLSVYNDKDWNTNKYKETYKKLKKEYPLDLWTTEDLIEYYKYSYSIQKIINKYQIKGIDLMGNRIKWIGKAIYKDILPLKKEFSINQDKISPCCVCKEHNCSVIFIPCGHMCVCEYCYGKLESNKKCPMCRKTISETIVSYI